ncbi:MAG: hypothetical protein EHM24_13380 [Acidobacteria bacterium]|nr:MAG: hypothetical protein EHM24_13380 [Acidobacteriota bacterium]
MARTWKSTARATRLVLLAMMFMTLAVRSTPAVPPSDRTSPEYTVASGEVPARSGATVKVPVGLDPLRSVPEKLALVMVGGLLLGLAAAVRRTT